MKILQPAGWPRPSGYANGISASGRLIFTAGMIGWDEREMIVSHRLEELKQISDRVTVMRDGKYIDTLLTREAPIQKIISLMVSTASSAVRTSGTSWYIWSGMSHNFWKTSPFATFRTPCEPPSEPCHANVCSHSPGAGTNSVGPWTIRREIVSEPVGRL